MNDFMSKFKWYLIGGGALILVIVIAVVVVLINTGSSKPAAQAAHSTAAAPKGKSTASPVPGTEPSPGDIEHVDRQSFDGKGKASQSFKAGGGVTIIKLDHKGRANFIVNFSQGDGPPQLLVNAVGLFSGAKGLALPIGDYKLDIDTDGEWSVQIDQSVPASADAAPQKLSGKGQSVSKFFHLRGGTATFAMNYSGDGLFAPNLIKADGTSTTLLANELDHFSGSKDVPVTDGVYLIDVQSTGAWSIDVSQ